MSYQAQTEAAQPLNNGPIQRGLKVSPGLDLEHFIDTILEIAAEKEAAQS